MERYKNYAIFIYWILWRIKKNKDQYPMIWKESYLYMLKTKQKQLQTEHTIDPTCKHACTDRDIDKPALPGDG